MELIAEIKLNFSARKKIKKAIEATTKLKVNLLFSIQ